jgi:hypothetical protein
MTGKAALELHAPFETGDQQVPKWLCNGTIGRSLDAGTDLKILHLPGRGKWTSTDRNLGLEPPYNALAYRMHQNLPYTRKLLLEQRPAEIGEPNPLFIGFETVTNAEEPF